MGNANMWVVKPGSKSKGAGIRLTHDPCSFKDHLAQKYIERPLILHSYSNPAFNGKKFDIRQWVLVRSFMPL